MRASKSRSRSKGNRNRSVGNIVNRVFESSGPEGKVRGTPQQIIEKYNQLARDAQLSNDRVAAENFQQHAEPYLRMLAEAMREQQERQQHQQNSNPNQNNGQGGNDQQDDDQPNTYRQGHQDQDDQPQEGRRNRDRQQQPSEGQRDQQAARHKPREPRAEVIEVDSSEDAGLVETPEDKPKRVRRPRAKPEAKTEAQVADQPRPDAAE